MDLLDKLQLLPNPIHQGIKPKSKLGTNDDVSSLIVSGDPFDFFERYRVHLVENVKTWQVFSGTKKDIDKLVGGDLRVAR